MRRPSPRPGRVRRIGTIVGGCCCHVARCVVRFFGDVVVVPHACVRSSSCVGPVPVLGGFVVSVRSSADVVATLRRVVRFSGDVVVVPHACVRSSSCVGPVPVLGGFVVSVRSSADVVATLRRVVRFSGDVVVVPHACVRSSSCVGPVPVREGSSYRFDRRRMLLLRCDVVATLRVVWFSGDVVVVPHACVRSSSCVGPVPVLGGFVVSVRSSANVVATLRVVWFSGDVVVVPPAYVRYIYIYDTISCESICLCPAGLEL